MLHQVHSKPVRLQAVLLCLFFLSLTFYSEAQTFRNPIRGGAADPAMVHYNGFYYLTYTNGSKLAIVKSATIAGLSTTSATTVWTDATSSRCCFMWAPDIKLLNKPDGAPGEKRWYLYYSAADAPLNNIHRNYVLESSGLDPLGPYTFKGKLNPLNEDARAIDANILVKDNGALYYLWASDQNTKISIATMSNPWTVNGNKVVISSPTYAWEKAGAAVNENPAILKRNGKTYITYSASTCYGPDYTVGMLVNTDGNYTNPGSWTKVSTPVFVKAPSDGVYGPGGSDFFKSPDGLEDWIIYHATTNSAGACDGTRSARIGKIYWDVNDKPMFGAPTSTSTDLFLPSGDAAANPDNTKQIFSGSTYKIIHKGTNQALEVTGNSQLSGANVRQSADKNYGSQKWIPSRQTDGTFKVLHKGTTNQVLSSLNNSAAAGTNIVQATEAGQNGQRWSLLLQPDGHYRFLRKGTTNISLDVVNNTSAEGANVHQWTSSNVNGQRWRVISTGEVISGATYRLRHKATNQYLSSENNTNSVGNVVQMSGSSSQGQQWVVTAQTDGYYKLTRKGTNVCLDVLNNVSTPGADIIQYTDNGVNGQRWSLVHLSDGYFKLVHKGTNQCVEVFKNSSSSGADVIQNTDNGSTAQAWKLELVSLPGGQPLLAAPQTEENLTMVESSSIEEKLPTSLTVSPNPINSSATITFSQGITGEATVALYDLSGKLIKTIYKGTLERGKSNTWPLSKGFITEGYYIVKAWNAIESKTSNILIQ